MLATRGYAAKNSKSRLEPFDFFRRDLKPHDVLIKILYCGVCHSDIHQARNEWGIATYPVVPGHEIIGKIVQVGGAVKKFKVDDIAGVGCFVDSCRHCASCGDGEEQYCEKGVSFTYCSVEQDQQTPTQGGYSSQIVVDENYALKIPAKLLSSLANVAPLLCAGVTTYVPLKRFNAGPNRRVGVIGLGGLGHMGVKIAAALGADVTVFSTSAAKEQDARRFGARHFIVTKDPKNLESSVNQFDLILDTVSAEHDLNLYLNLLKKGGVLALVGVPEKPMVIEPFSVISNRRELVGSMIGGIKETQAMLDFCAEKNITADVEIIPIQKIEDAFTRTIKGDVRFRFVIDMNTL